MTPAFVNEILYFYMNYTGDTSTVIDWPFVLAHMYLILDQGVIILSPDCPPLYYNKYSS